MGFSRASVVYVTIEFLMSLFLSMIYACVTIMRIQVVGMTPLQLVLTGTVLEASCFLLEIPTGVIADTYSRRLSILIGIFLLGASTFIIGMVPIVWVQLAIEVVSGAGYTFLSGAQQAWITDEVGASEASTVFFRASQWGSVGGVIGIVCAMALGSINIILPIMLGGAALIALAVGLIPIMPEQGFKPVPRGERSSFQQLFGTFSAGFNVVRGSRTLLLIVTLALFFGAASESYDRLNQAHLLQTLGIPDGFTPIIWFGLFSLAAVPLHVGMTEFIRRRVDLENPRAVARTLMLLNGGLLVAVLLFALSPSIGVAMVAFMLVGMFRGASGPLKDAWVNQQTTSNVRATVFSMVSQADAVGQVAGGPLVGAIGNVSLRAALALGSLLLAPNLWLYQQSLRNSAPVQTE